MYRVVLLLASLLPAAVHAQVDTLRVDSSGSVPTLYLRDSSLASGVSSATASDTLAVVRYGPEPAASGAASAPPRRPRPVVGLLWIGAIALALLVTAVSSYESWRRRKRRLDAWEAERRR